jgi:hypothetical protein
MSDSTMLFCGKYRCLREAKWVPAEVEIKDNRTAATVILCGVHKGARTREKWGKPVTFVPLSERPEVVAAARVYRNEERELRAQARTEADAKYHAQRVGNSAFHWRELDEEPDYVLVYEEEERRTPYRSLWPAMTRPQTQRGWVAYRTTDLVDPERRHRYLFKVTVDDQQDFPDITDPATIDTTISSRFTAKLAPLYAEALLKAAEAVNARNVELRAKHESEAK